MQEEVNQKTISIIIKGGKISGTVLKNSLKFLLTQMQKEHARPGKGSSPPQKGKQTLETLRAQGKDLSNIQITSKNIGSFDRYARKYCIDYALKKDSSVKPPTYYVFFKAKDVDAMTAAFREYTNVAARKAARPSVCKKLAKALVAVRNGISPSKARKRTAERSR